MSLLKVDAIKGGYGPVKVLFGVTLDIQEGEIVALMGRNGMGKTTTIRMLTGALRADEGEISFRGQRITALADYKIARLGIGLVPEGRQVFPNLTVDEHLIVAERRKGQQWTRERVFALFPRLEERRDLLAGTLSGGEQQMLAVGRALVTNPQLLILDEATEGLAPLMRQEIWTCLTKIVETGISVLVVDRDLAALSKIAQRTFVLAKGQTAYSGPLSEFYNNKDLHQKYLGV